MQPSRPSGVSMRPMMRRFRTPGRPSGPPPTASGGPGGTREASLLPDLEPGEARDRHVLPRARGDVRTQLLDRLALVAIGVDVLLLEQRDLALPLGQLSADDLLHDLVGLAVLAGAPFEHLAFRLPGRVRDFLLRHVERPRRRTRDVNRHLAGELAELLVARDEIGLAPDLYQYPHPAGRVDVGADHALASRPPALLRRRRLSLDPQQLDRLLHVAAGLLERGLAIHHPGTGALAERLDVGRADLRAR